MRRGSLVHPRLIKNLESRGFFPMKVTLQRRNDGSSRTPSGGFTSPAAWTDVVGLVNVPCRRGVPESAQRQGREMSTADIIAATDTYVVILNGHYPNVRPDMRALMSDGQAIDISGVVSDSAGVMTTFTGRVITPGSEGFK